MLFRAIQFLTLSSESTPWSMSRTARLLGPQAMPTLASGLAFHQRRIIASSLLASSLPLGTRPPSGFLVFGMHGNTHHPRRRQFNATSSISGSTDKTQTGFAILPLAF